VAAQNVFDRPNGAFTGEISVEQLKDSGITWTLLGHSERRTILREEDEFIAKKTLTAVTGGIGVIFCCGESLEEREKGTTVEVVTKQLDAINKAIEKDHWKQIVIAYEPIWAIGTGKVATTGKHTISKRPLRCACPLKQSPSRASVFGTLTGWKRAEQAQEVHAAIREWLAKSVSPEAAESTRIIYGGSVSDKNCGDLAKQSDIDGFLVGGASLKPACQLILSPIHASILGPPDEPSGSMYALGCSC
jgi:triosephosphate isomerase